MMKKYFKPKSLTWWASFIPLTAGCFVASLPLHGLTDAVMVVNNITNGATPAEMINLGLIGIGLRGAMQ